METSWKRSELFWLADCFDAIDFSITALLKECFTISFWSKGGYTYQGAKELPFDEFEIVLREAKRIEGLHINKGSGEIDG